MFWSGIADEAGAPLDRQMAAHKELGWTHIELRKVNDTTAANASDDEFKRIHEQLNEAGMQVSCFAGAIANWARDVTDPFEPDIEELKRSIPRMQATGTKFVRIMSYVNNNGLSDAEWRKEALRRIGELARMAEDGGVVLVHENCHGWASQSPENIQIMLGEINSPALKVVFDTGNSTGEERSSFDFCKGLDPEEIVYVHVKDIKLGQGATWPGEGDSEVARTIEDLLKNGYDGGLSIEPHMAAVIHLDKESDPEHMFKTYVEYGRRAMALVEEIQSRI